jgi:hypothetical protein
LPTRVGMTDVTLYSTKAVNWMGRVPPVRPSVPEFLLRSAGQDGVCGFH